jgi:hypothetical protein
MFYLHLTIKFFNSNFMLVYDTKLYAYPVIPFTLGEFT